MSDNDIIKENKTKKMAITFTYQTRDPSHKIGSTIYEKIMKFNN